MRRTKMQEKV